MSPTMGCRSAPCTRWLSAGAATACAAIIFQRYAVPMLTCHAATQAYKGTLPTLCQRSGHPPMRRHINGNQRVRPQSP